MNDNTAEDIGFVTEDKWMKGGGRMDIVDREILKEASQGGRLRVKVINMREMLLIMEASEPEKFQQFKGSQEKQAGRPLTFDELVEFGTKANERMSEFTALVKDMSREQAVIVRRWRVNERMTWRRVAMAAYIEEWFGWGWQPPANQLMGMALTERAAQLFGENYREPPWN